MAASRQMLPPGSFQPLVPEPKAGARLLERAAELVAEGHRLETGGRGLAGALTPLMRSMNRKKVPVVDGEKLNDSTGCWPEPQFCTPVLPPMTVAPWAI